MQKPEKNPECLKLWQKKFVNRGKCQEKFLKVLIPVKYPKKLQNVHKSLNRYKIYKLTFNKFKIKGKLVEMKKAGKN